MPKIIDLTNQKFGKLLVIQKVKGIDRNSRWLCICECGKTKEVRASHLKNIDNCGCETQNKKLKKYKHGNSSYGSRTPEYISWNSMMGRCYTITDDAYNQYGGRGIKVCESWHDFTNFKNDMGNRPFGKSLDRINTNDDYYLENCRWASKSQQQNNKRCNIILEYQGKKLTLMEWSLTININYRTLKQRIMLGWTNEKVLTTPVRKKVKNGN